MFYPAIQVLIGIILVIILILGFYHIKHKLPKKNVRQIRIVRIKDTTVYVEHVLIKVV